MIKLDLVQLWQDMPRETIHAAISAAMAPRGPAAPRDLAGAIAAMVRDSSDDGVVALVGPELLRRLGLADDDGEELRRAQALAATWEQTADAARTDAAQARRETSEASARADAARTEIHLLDRLAASFQIERDQACADRDAVYAIGWEAICARDANIERAEMFRGDLNTVSSLFLDAAKGRRETRAHGHRRARRLIAALRAKDTAWEQRFAKAAQAASARADELRPVWTGTVFEDLAAEEIAPPALAPVVAVEEAPPISPRYALRAGLDGKLTSVLIVDAAPVIEAQLETARADGAELHTRDVGGEFIVDAPCPGECDQVESECTCAPEPVVESPSPAVAADDLHSEGAIAVLPPVVSGFQLIEAAKVRGARVVPPAPPSPTAIPGPPTSRPDVAPLALLVTEQGRTSPPRAPRAPKPLPRPARVADLATKLNARTFEQRETARLAAGAYDRTPATETACTTTTTAPATLDTPATASTAAAPRTAPPAPSATTTGPAKTRAEWTRERDRSRNARPREVRAATTNVERLSRVSLAVARAEQPDANVRRLPMHRGDCAQVERPCPYVTCTHHLYLDVNPDNGSIKFNYPDLEPDELEQSCVLDVALGAGDPATGHGVGITLDEVGKILNVTRERIRQIEVKGITKLEGLRGRVLRDFVDVPSAAPLRRAPALAKAKLAPGELPTDAETTEWSAGDDDSAEAAE